MPSLTIAISPCPNDTFTFGYLIEKLIPWSGPILNIQYFDINTLNQLGLGNNAPDILKFSYALWPKIKENYYLCSYGSALGIGVGPLLIATKGKEIQDIKTVLIPGLNTTANLLFQKFGADLPVKVERYDRILPLLKQHEDWAGVIIHESRFTYAQHDLEVLCDLGAMWEVTTQCPLPLGGIAIHKRVPFPLAQNFAKALQQSLACAWQDRSPLSKLIQSHAQEMSEDVIAQHIELYVNTYSGGLNSTAIKAIQTLTGEDCGNIIVSA
jgi:1,4-dihydroxy-6-naphthoate synthase